MFFRLLHWFVDKITNNGEIRTWRTDENLDTLLTKACDWLHDYLKYSPFVPEDERGLCDGVGN